MIRKEIIYSYKKNSNKFIICFILILLINLINIYMIKKNGVDLCTNESYIFDLFKGAEYFQNSINIEIPYIWIVLNITVISLSCNCLEKGENNEAIYAIMRYGKVRFWFIKEVCTVINIIIWYSMIFGVTWIMSTICFKRDFNFQFYAQIFSLYILTSIMFSIINSTLNIFIKSKYAYISTISLLVISLVSNFKFMPGQQSILLRHVPYNMISGITTVYSIVYDILISIICIYVQYKYIKYKDIY